VVVVLRSRASPRQLPPGGAERGCRVQVFESIVHRSVRDSASARRGEVGSLYPVCLEINRCDMITTGHGTPGFCCLIVPIEVDIRGGGAASRRARVRGLSSYPIIHTDWAAAAQRGINDHEFCSAARLCHRDHWGYVPAPGHAAPGVVNDWYVERAARGRCCDPLLLRVDPEGVHVLGHAVCSSEASIGRVLEGNVPLSAHIVIEPLSLRGRERGHRPTLRATRWCWLSRSCRRRSCPPI
jgi:hypothetical protein